MGVFSDELDKERQQQDQLDRPKVTAPGRSLTTQEQMFGPTDPRYEPPPLNRDIYDVTVGALLHGAADTAGLAARGLPIVGDTAPMVKFAAMMGKYKEQHPEYSPVEVDSAWDLLRSPGALSSRVFGGAPQMIAGVAALETGGAALAAGLAYATESRRAYESAIASGANDEDAVKAGRLTGALNAGLEVLQSRRILNFAEGTKGVFAAKVTGRAEAMMRALHLPADATGMVVSAATYGALQGAATDGIANLVYGKDIKEGFIDRRMQESISGAVSGGILGAFTKYLKVPKTGPDGQPAGEVTLDAYDRNSFRDYLMNERKMELEPATHIAEITDAFARNWASRNNRSVEEFYGQFVNGKAPSTGKNLLEGIAPVEQVFKSAKPEEAIRNFGELIQPLMAPSDVQTMKDHGLNTPKQISDAFAKYLGEGQAPAPELVSPFEFFKDTLKDVFNTVKSTYSADSGDIRDRLDIGEGFTLQRKPQDPKLKEVTYSYNDPTGKEVGLLELRPRGDYGMGVITNVLEPALRGKGIGARAMKSVADAYGRVSSMQEADITPAAQSMWKKIVDSGEGQRRETKVRDSTGQPGAVFEIDRTQTPEMSSQLRAAFDRVLSIDTDQIGEARRRLYSSEQNLLNIKKATDKSTQPFTLEELYNKQTPARHAILDWLEGKKPELSSDARRGVGAMLADREQRFADRQREITDLQAKKQTMTPEQWTKFVPVRDASPGGEAWLQGLMRVQAEAEQNINQLRSVKPDTSKADPIGAPEPGNLFRMGKTELELQDETVKAMHEDLRRLQLSRDLPDRDSAVARRAATQASIREALRLETPAQLVIRNGFQKAADSLASLVNFSAPLRRYQWGRKTLDFLSDVLGHQHSIEGEYYDSNWNAYKNLTKQDRQWLAQVDEQAATEHGVRLDNFTRFIEAVGVPNPIAKAPTASLEQYRDQVKKIMVDLGSRAEREGMLVKLGDGDVIPYKQPKELRMLRFLTDDARVALEDRRGEVYDAIKKVVVDQAKRRGEKVDLAGVEKTLQDYGKGLSVRESGPLTDARTLPVMPTEVVTASGSRVKVLHTEPFQFLNRAVRTQAYQIGWNRVIGTDEISTIASKDMRRFLESAGFESPYNINVLKQRFAAQGIPVPEHVDDLVGLEKVAKDVGVPSGPKRKEYVAALDKITVDDINSKNIEALREFARKVGGVNPDAPSTELLNEVKLRAREKPLDVIEALSKGLAAEGGDVKRLVNAIRLSQGIPIYRTHSGFLERDPVVRGAKLLSGFIGSLQTSMSVVANIPQTLVQVPQLAGLGRYLDAVDAVMRDRRSVTQTVMGLGAIGDVHQAWGLERGYMMEGIARNVRQAAQFGTGMKFISDVNNIVAGEAFRRLALDWKAQPSEFSPSDVRVAKQLRLTDVQIKEIQSGKMSDLTFSKVVQNGVAVTQFVTESAHNRGFLENHPIMRLVLAYNSYASGTARATGDFYRSWKDAVSSGDTRSILNMTHRTGILLGASLGAGLMGEAFRNVIRGDVAREQKRSTLEQGVGALLSIQLFGPTQRLFDSFQYAKGSTSNYITGLMPQVRAVQELIGLGYNAAMTAAGSEDRMGANAGFDLWTQAERALETHTPMLKAALRWREQVAYPNTPMYNEVRAAVDTWRGEVAPEKKYLGEATVNPDYIDIHRWVVRGDKEMAMKAAQDYYDRKRQQFAEDPEVSVARGMTLQSARIGLRASLEAKKPIDLNTPLMIRYLKTLPDQKREQYLKVNRDYMRIVNSVAPSNS